MLHTFLIVTASVLVWSGICLNWYAHNEMGNIFRDVNKALPPEKQFPMAVLLGLHPRLFSMVRELERTYLELFPNSMEVQRARSSRILSLILSGTGMILAVLVMPK